MTQGNIWGDILNQDPSLAYQSFANQWGTGRQKEWYEQNFQRVFGDYQEQIARLMRQGTAPTQNFTNWLEKLNFGRNWRGMAPGMAGRSPTSSLNPFISMMNRNQRFRQ